MSIISRIESAGFKIHKGSLFCGKPCEPKDSNDFNFYIEVPSGEFKGVYMRLDDIFYIGQDKIPCTRRKIIKELYSPSDEDMCLYEFHISLKTKKYFDEISDSIGLINIVSGEDLSIVENETTRTLNSLFMNADVTITKYDNEYLIYISSWNGEYTDVIVFTFRQDPKPDEISVAYKIFQCYNDFLSNKLSEEFTCWECGNTLHWLDIKGDFLTKYSYLQSKYCGC